MTDLDYEPRQRPRRPNWRNVIDTGCAILDLAALVLGAAAVGLICGGFQISGW
jgi:hypothetical protein